MEEQEILLQLQKGKITPEEAKLKLIKLLEAGKKDSVVNSDRNDEVDNSCIVGEETNIKIVEVTEISPYIVIVKMQDRKNKNTFSIQLIEELTQVFKTIQLNNTYKAIILTGYDSYFACGGNEEGMKAIYNKKFKMTDVKLHQLTLDCKIPVIAAMQGHAIGSGLCLGLFSDFVIMSSESIYTCNHMQYGFTPGDGATLILPQKLGFNLGQEMLYTGKKYKGKELKEKGATITILPRKEVLPYAIEFAKQFENMPIESLRLLKNHMTHNIKTSLDAILSNEWTMQEKTFLQNPETIKKITSVFHNAKIENTYNNDSSKKYDELIKLNDSANGVPIFWIHGEGGLEGYQTIAKNCNRPFYGIQTQNRLGKRFTFESMKELATYYIKVIKSIQNSEPYDLGGYSIGGLIAFEMTRQLQEMGEKVNTITMIDTFDLDVSHKLKYSYESRILQTVNMSLVYRSRKELKDLFPILINREIIKEKRMGENLLTELIRIGRKRKGLSQTKTEQELFVIFKNSLDFKLNSYIQNYECQPLCNSDQINCYYLRNMSGSLFGDFQPYFSMDNVRYLDENEVYWREWKKYFKKFDLIEINSSNHMTMLFESKATDQIQNVIKKIYE